jgi:hypothetical protein
MHAGFRWWGALAALIWLLCAGCGVDRDNDRAPGVTGGNARTLGFDGAAGPGIRTDRASYLFSETINVEWIDLPGNGGDWISIAPVGSGPTVVTRWQYTGGAAAGTAGFTLTAGTYEARAYVDNGYTVVATSAPFTVTGSAASVSTNKTSYLNTETVNVAWSGLPGDNTDWVSIAPVGSGPTVVTRWAYTGGAASGTTGFSVPPGSYVARAYASGNYTVLATSATFNVTGSFNTTIVTDKTSYGAAETVNVAWADMPGDPADWISIAPVGSGATVLTQWRYTGGATSGSAPFTGLAAGSYEARAYASGGYTISARSAPFTVGMGGNATVATDKTSYRLHDSIVVTFSNMPGGADWIAIATPSSPPSTFLAMQYTGGAQNGTLTFQLTGQARGSYEVRAFFNNSYTISARSDAFRVGDPFVSTDNDLYSTTDTITVSYGDGGPSSQDWVSIARPTTAGSSFVQWKYVTTIPYGSVTFTGVGAGTYVARFMGPATYAIGAETPNFIVASGPTVLPARYSHLATDNVRVRFINLTGGADEFIALSTPGAPASTILATRSTSGATRGTVDFGPVAAGNYVARVFYANDGVVRAESAVFAASPATPPPWDSIRLGSHGGGGLRGGKAYFWGSNAHGEEGYSWGAPALVPRPMAATMSFTSLAAGASHACGIATDGFTYCWGANSAWQVGDASGQPTKSNAMCSGSRCTLGPARVTTPPTGDFQAITTRRFSTCGITNAPNYAYCWGADYGPYATIVGPRLAIELGGDGVCEIDTQSHLTCRGPNPNWTVTSNVRLYSSARVHTRHGCAFDTTGVLYCFGDNTAGELGTGDTTSRSTPTPVTMPSGVSFTDARVGNQVSCGLSSTGTVYCWGSNASGALGQGTTDTNPHPLPVLVPGLSQVSAITVGEGAVCALSQGQRYCWGNNAGGMLGDGTTTNRLSPTAVP